MDGQDNSVRQEAAASTPASDQLPENTEADAEKRNDLLERSVLLNMEDNEVFTPEDHQNDSDARKELEKNARVDKELRKISSTNPAGTKESVNLPSRRSQKPTLPNARLEYRPPWKRCRQHWMNIFRSINRRNSSRKTRGRKPIEGSNG